MSKRTRRILADEEGLALVTVILVSMLMMALLSLTLRSGEQADRSSARGRNFDVALAIAEAGVQEGIAKIQVSGGGSVAPFSGSMSEGSYSVSVTKSISRYEVRSQASAGGSQLGRDRVVKVTLRPPASFKHALYSDTSIDLKNNDTVKGDVWANDSVRLDAHTVVDGSLTAARSWIDLDQWAEVKKDAWSGGFNSSGPFAIRLAKDAKIRGNAKASVSAPNDPSTCGGELSVNYAVPIDAGAEITGSLTTWGDKTGTGSVNGAYSPHVCTEAAIPSALPPFAYNPSNYDAATLHEFSSVSAFQNWLNTGTNKSNFTGTFYVNEAAPSQTARVDLSGVSVTGDATVVTNAPVYTSEITDSGTQERIFTVVSSYAPPTGSACDVNHDSSECAVHIKNGFQPSCKTVALIYADRGPVALKNNSAQCGAIYANSILVKNNQTLTYDSRIERIVGFGGATYEVSRWEELSAT